MDISELKELLQLLRSQGVHEYSTPALSLKLNTVFEDQKPDEQKPAGGQPPDEVVRALAKLPAQYGKVMRGV